MRCPNDIGAGSKNISVWEINIELILLCDLFFQPISLTFFVKMLLARLLLFIFSTKYLSMIKCI